MPNDLTKLEARETALIRAYNDCDDAAECEELLEEIAFIQVAMMAMMAMKGRDS